MRGAASFILAEKAAEAGRIVQFMLFFLMHYAIIE